MSYSREGERLLVGVIDGARHLLSPANMACCGGRFRQEDKRLRAPVRVGDGAGDLLGPVEIACCGYGLYELG